MSESFSLRISFYFVFGPSQANLELMYAKVIASSINTIFRWKFNISVHQWDPMKIYWFRTVDRAKKLRRRRRRRILINWFSTVDLQSNSNRQKEKQLRAWQKKHKEKLYFSSEAMRRMRGQSSGQSACPCGIYPHFYLFVVVVAVVVVVISMLPMSVAPCELSALLIVKMLTRTERSINIHNGWTFDPTLHPLACCYDCFLSLLLLCMYSNTENEWKKNTHNIVRADFFL